MAMASYPVPLRYSTPLPSPNPKPRLLPLTSRRKKVAFVTALSADESSRKPTKLVTFLGKGGSGKTTAAVLAAQHYAREGLRTCLVIQSQDLTAESLMGCMIGSSPSQFSQNLSALRLETTKMLLEPLAQLKKADARVNLTQGILEGIVGEELGILTGMDSIFTALELEKLTNFLGIKRSVKQDFDVVVYDGISTEETLRLIGSAERARHYLKYVRNMADKTDIGRLTAPSILKLASESISINRGVSDGKLSAEIWNDLERVLERASASFSDSSRFRCYLVIDPSRPSSFSSAMRYWGCAIQAGTEISGALAFAEQSSISAIQIAKKNISPLPLEVLPYLFTDTPVDWDKTLNTLDDTTKHLLNTPSSNFKSLVQFDETGKTVTLFMPGFNKSEIKLYQYKGGSELLVEAGDQRRVIRLPAGMQGKVSGAKFVDSGLTVTLR